MTGQMIEQMIGMIVLILLLLGLTAEPCSCCQHSDGDIVGSWDVVPIRATGDFMPDEPDVLVFYENGDWTGHDHEGRTMEGTYTIDERGVIHATISEELVVEDIPVSQNYIGRLCTDAGTLQGHFDIEVCYGESYWEECLTGTGDVKGTRQEKSAPLQIEDSTASSQEGFSRAISRLVRVGPS